MWPGWCSCAMRIPVLRCRHFLHGKDEPAPGILDIAWFDTHGEIISSESWNNPEKRLFALRRASRNDDGTVPILTLFLNPSETGPRVPAADAERCRRACCSTAPIPTSRRRDIAGEEITVAARSAVLTKSILTTVRHELVRQRSAVRRKPERRRHAISALGSEAEAGSSVQIEGHDAVPMRALRRRLVRGRGRVRRRDAVSLSAGARGSRVPDPASRAQADDVHGPSLVVDPRAYRVAQPGLARAALARSGALRAACRRVRRLCRRAARTRSGSPISASRRSS